MSAIGKVLRRTRDRQGLTLHDVTTLSGGRLKPSTLGSYERGERSLSLERLTELAGLYRMPPELLLREALQSLEPHGSTEIVVDLTRLEGVGTEEGARLSEFVGTIIERRGDSETDVITLRAGDVVVMAAAAQQQPNDFLVGIRDAVRDPA